MLDELKGWIPKISASFTAFQAKFADTVNLNWKPTENTAETDDLQDTIKKQNKPSVRVRGRDIQSEQGRGTWVDQIRLTLGNYGEGVAENLHIRPSLVVSYENEVDELQNINIEDACFLTGDGAGFEFQPSGFRLTRSEEGSVENSSVQGGVLSTTEGEAEFYAQVEFKEKFYSDKGSSSVRVPFFEATQRLYDVGIRRVSFSLYVLYTDMHDNRYAEQVMGKTGDIDGGVTFIDVSQFQHSVEYSSHDELLERVRESNKYPR